MLNYAIILNLESETTFGNGEGVAGLVDVEAQHDSTGCPYLSGRALRGLLVEECAGLLFAQQRHARLNELEQSAQRLFGGPGSSHAEQSGVSISDALLPEGLRKAVREEVTKENATITRQEVLEAFTVIRHQTAVNEETGAPREKSLRSLRAILPGTRFEAGITFSARPQGFDLPLLAACISALRRAGLGRNRGRGQLSASLLDENGRDVTSAYLDEFIEIIKGAA